MSIHQKNIIVTGGAGFIGSHLTDALLEQGHRVVVIDNLTTGKKENLNSKAEFHQLDIRNIDSIKPLFKNIDYVFHLAALPRIQPSIQNPIECNSINLDGTLNVLVCARDAKVKKFIYSASSSAYGDQTELPLVETMIPSPKNPYALQKYVGELYCKMFSKLYGLPTVCLKYFNVYGPRHSYDGPYATVIAIFLRQRANGESMTVVGDGTMRRDFTYVGDVVRANLLAMKSDKVGSGEAINIGAGKNYSINEVVQLTLEKTNDFISRSTYSVKSINFNNNEPIIYISPRPGEAKVTLADNRKAKELLAWQPEVYFEDGLQKTIEHDLSR